MMGFVAEAMKSCFLMFVVFDSETFFWRVYKVIVLAPNRTSQHADVLSHRPVKAVPWEGRGHTSRSPLQDLVKFVFFVCENKTCEGLLSAHFS